METRLRASPEQFLALLEFMESHGDIARPQPGAQARLKADYLWQELGELLNSLGGVRRPIEKWKKVWADWKAKTKKKALLLRRKAVGTGATNGAPIGRVTLTAPEKRVLFTMGLMADVGQVEIEKRFDGTPLQRDSSTQVMDIKPECSSETNNIELNVIPCDSSEGNSTSPPPSPFEVSWLPTSQTPSARVPTPMQSTSPIATTSGAPHQRHAATPSPNGASPRRQRLLRRRARRTPFERATCEFVGVENRRLELEEERERNHHQREMERLRLESRRIEMEEKRNQIFTHLNRVLDNLTEYIAHLQQ